MSERRERGILATLHRGNQTQDRVAYSLQELARLADTAGVVVLDQLIQKRDKPDPATYFGKWKIQELAQRIETFEATLLIVNDHLSPVQVRNLEESLNVQVVDRTQLILDIFAKRARTYESKLQVELAQYQYLLPRLAGAGKQMSRLGGGIGTRGPGETKLETDRRKIRDKIADLKKQLEYSKQQRQLQQKRRKKDGVIQIILTGYTNAGKSSLLNRLTGAKVLEEDRLFATLDPTMRKKVLPSGIPVVFVDTVGFIQDLPTQLIAAFRSTLEIVQEADLILHIIDGSDPEYEQKIKVVEEHLRDLDAIDIPRIEVYTKKDLYANDKQLLLHNDAIAISTFDKKDIQKLLQLIDRHIQHRYSVKAYKIPFTEPQQKAKIYSESFVLQESINEQDGVWEIVSLTKR